MKYYYDPNLKYQKGRIRVRILILSVLLLGLVGLVGYKKVYPWVMDMVQAKQRATDAKNVQVTISKPTPKEQTKETGPVPESARLDVPYTVQAPSNTWHNPDGAGYVHQESCEEAAIIMTHYYIEGTKFPDNKIPADVALVEMDKLIAYQNEHYGGEHDLTLAQVGQLAHDVYGYNYYLIDNMTQDDIKREIAAGHVVIVSSMTQPLRDQGHGYYSAGNVYHVYPVIGYKGDGVITNDNGFTQGQNWFYTWDVFFAGIDQQNVNPGRQGLVLYK